MENQVVPSRLRKPPPLEAELADKGCLVLPRPSGIFLARDTHPQQTKKVANGSNRGHPRPRRLWVYNGRRVPRQRGPTSELTLQKQLSIDPRQHRKQVGKCFEVRDKD